MTDTLFDMPDSGPDRLTRARAELSRALDALAAAEDAADETGLSTQLERGAVEAARYELHLAELERRQKP